jgi:hypothetical protein
MGMPKRLQAKDIPELPILELLAARRERYGEYSCAVVSGVETWATGRDGDKRLGHAMPDHTPYKVRYAKMQMLARRGLVYEIRNGGFVITDKGIAHLDNLHLDKVLREAAL